MALPGVPYMCLEPAVQGWVGQEQAREGLVGTWVQVGLRFLEEALCGPCSVGWGPG